jgi:hypothetical protein
VCALGKRTAGAADNRLNGHTHIGDDSDIPMNSAAAIAGGVRWSNSATMLGKPKITLVSQILVNSPIRFSDN